MTDAHLVRGTIRPDAFLGGTMRLDPDAAHRAFEPVAGGLGLSVREAAAAAIRLAVANIVRAIQLSRRSAGTIPGPMRCCPSAEPGRCSPPKSRAELGITEVLVPPNPGVISALGLSPPTT